MKKIDFDLRVFIRIIVYTITIATIGKTQSTDYWIARGSHPQDYTMGGNPVIQHGAENVGFIESIVDKVGGFGTYMTSIKPDKYIGKRLKMSAYVKTELVEGGAGLWMRIDGLNNQMLGFDNMDNRAITGLTDWNKYEVVLDVPQNCVNISYGLLMKGQGKTLFDGLEINVVDKSVSVTMMYDVLAYDLFENAEYEKALQYFKNAIKQQPNNLYMHIFYYLTLISLDKTKDAEEYINKVSSELKNENWISPVIHFYSGKLSEQELLKAAEHKDKNTQKQQQCEVFYYVGIAYKLNINKIAKDPAEAERIAKNYFKKCVDTGISDFVEYGLAHSELKF